MSIATAVSTFFDDIVQTIRGMWPDTEAPRKRSPVLNHLAYIDVGSVYLPSNDGVTRVQKVVVSRQGVFLIVVVPMSGWVFGSANTAQWTQNLMGKRMKFSSPLYLAYKQAELLVASLNIDPMKVFPMVVFKGECELRTEMPSNVMVNSYVDFVRSKDRVLLSETEVSDIISHIRTHLQPKPAGIVTAHH